MQQRRHRRPTFLGTLAVLLVLGSLIAPTAQAGLFLAPVTSFLPLKSLDDLTAACVAAQPGSTLYAMYTTGVRPEVDQLLTNASTTQVYVSASFTTATSWSWVVVQGGQTDTVEMLPSAFVGGTLPSNSSGPFVVYDSAQAGMLAATGKQDYKALCYVLKMVDPPRSKSSFPWWAILIIVLVVVVILVVVIVVVVCCCCRKKRTYTDDDDGSSFSSSRSGSFSTRGSSFSGSSTCDSSRSSRSSTSRTSSTARSSTSGSASASQSETSSASSHSQLRSASTSSHSFQSDSTSSSNSYRP